MNKKIEERQRNNKTVKNPTKCKRIRIGRANTLHAFTTYMILLIAYRSTISREMKCQFHKNGSAQCEENKLLSYVAKSVEDMSSNRVSPVDVDFRTYSNVCF